MIYFITAIIFCFPLFAFEITSGISPEAISLPSVSGHYNGFKLDEVGEGNRGELNYRFRIEVPRGVNSFHPDIAIAYKASSGQSPWGLGWDIDLPSIAIDSRNGVPKYDSSDKFSSSEGRLVRILKTGIGGSQFFAPEINPNQSLYEFFPATKEWIWHKNDGHRIYYST